MGNTSLPESGIECIDLETLIEMHKIAARKLLRNEWKKNL